MNMRRARLYVLTGSSAGKMFELLDPKISVGRIKENRLWLDDGNVSHQHAMLTRVGDDYQVIDLNSTNGTFINGQRIHAPTPLHHGDKVRFGTIELQYESTEVAAEIAPADASVKVEPVRRSETSKLGWAVAIISALALGGFIAFHFQYWPFSERGPLARFVKSTEQRVLDDPDYLAAQSAETAKDYPKLLKHAQALAARFPDQSMPYFILGVGYGEMEFFDEAIKALNHAIDLKPDYADAWDNLGWVNTRAGKFPEAVRAYKQGLKLKPTDAKAWNSLGGAYAASGKTTDAIAAYEKAIELKPDYADAYYNLGVVHAADEETVAALRAFREATKLNPKLVEAWYDLGILSHQSGGDDEAMIFFEKALKLKPDYSDAWAGLIKTYLALDQKEKAVEAAAQLKKIDPAKAEELAHELQGLTPK